MRLARVCGPGLQPRSSLCRTSASEVAVCDLRRYTSVIYAFAYLLARVVNAFPTYAAQDAVLCGIQTVLSAEGWVCLAKISSRKVYVLIAVNVVIFAVFAVYLRFSAVVERQRTAA